MFQYRDKVKILAMKGLDGQMEQKPIDENSLAAETNFSIGNESLPHNEINQLHSK